MSELEEVLVFAGWAILCIVMVIFIKAMRKKAARQASFLDAGPISFDDGGVDCGADGGDCGGDGGGGD
ncbi:hypothetical protein [Rufibacter immobilis]|uniref:hypothetical protein n=1 Tax=Rufibacter immobilis TaxID=1348778 RepID=UPI0035EDC5CC